MGKPAVQIVPARAAHAEELALRLRPEEVAEVRASGGYSPRVAVMEALAHSERAFTALFDGKVACMWGVEHVRRSAVAGRIGAVWLLTTDLVERHPKAFWRGCRGELASLLEAYDMLVNAIDVRHEKAIRWATRLGIPLEEAKPFGVEGHAFRWFKLRREDLHV